MKIEIITVGKLKEKHFRQAADEYLKRLQAYSKIEVKEIAEEKTQDPVKKAEITQVISKEGERILRQLHPDSYIIALAIQGKSFTSEAFAKQLDHLATYGKSHFTFIIGGSYGLSPQVLQQADLLLSFSEMTFPHQLIRIFLLEQIYRAYKINRGETYHK